MSVGNEFNEGTDDDDNDDGVDDVPILGADNILASVEKRFGNLN